MKVEMDMKGIVADELCLNRKSEYSAKSEPLGCSISSEWVALSTRYIQRAYRT